jgi:hypothetical protein
VSGGSLYAKHTTKNHNMDARPHHQGRAPSQSLLQLQSQLQSQLMAASAQWLVAVTHQFAGEKPLDGDPYLNAYLLDEGSAVV